MPDTWAFCERCARWFYCARIEGQPSRDCPACGMAARVTRQGRPEHPDPPAELSMSPAEPHQQV